MAPISTTGAGSYPAIGGGGLGLQTNLTAFWSFENTSWTDDTGNGSTLTGTASPTSVSGKVGNAVSLNGSTQCLQVASNTNLVTAGGSFSWQLWVNGNGTAANLAYIGKDANSFGNREWRARTRFVASNVYSWTAFNTSTTASECDSTVTISSGWHHLVGTFNVSGGVQKIYVDGVDATSGSPALAGTVNSSASAPFNFGNDGAGAILNTPTLIDQVGFWKGRVLSAADVTALYGSGPGNGLTYAAMA